MNNEIKTKDITASCSTGISADGTEGNSSKSTLGSPSISGSSLDKPVASSTYVATIRTPMDHQADMDEDMNASLTGLESDNPRAAGRLDRMKSRAQELTGTARERMGDMKGNMSHRASELSHTLSEKASETRHRVMDSTHHMTDQTRDTLRSNPSNTMLIAAGIGLAIGFITHRKH